jgi:hypothetical protein
MQSGGNIGMPSLSRAGAPPVERDCTVRDGDLDRRTSRRSEMIFISACAAVFVVIASCAAYFVFRLLG